MNTKVSDKSSNGIDKHTHLYFISTGLAITKSDFWGNSVETPYSNNFEWLEFETLDKTKQKYKQWIYNIQFIF